MATRAKTRDSKNEKLDMKSILIGIMISLSVQGFYETIFYFLQGKFVEESASLFASYIVIVVVYLTYYLMDLTGYFKEELEDHE